MKAWRVDRVDFAKDAGCVFCDRALPSNVAFIVRNVESDEAAAGPKCVKKHALFPEVRLPDFTRASPEVPEEEGAPRPAPSNRRGPSSGVRADSMLTKKGNAEVEYLRLRVEKLEGYRVDPDARLLEIYGRLQDNRLPDGDVAYLANLVAKFERIKSPWALANLQTCYAYAAWLERFQRQKPHEFVARLLVYLKDKLRLTPDQLEALNKFFSYREGFPELDPAAFSNYRWRKGRNEE